VVAETPGAAGVLRRPFDVGPDPLEGELDGPTVPPIGVQRELHDLHRAQPDHDRVGVGAGVADLADPAPEGVQGQAADRPVVAGAGVGGEALDHGGRERRLRVRGPGVEHPAVGQEVRGGAELDHGLVAPVEVVVVVGEPPLGHAHGPFRHADDN
jgi:hypothetical protein